tara:strand:+ start:702 stop:1127 length:426 start_codon:yes stop_codon:yes gene_type:complete
MIERKTPELDYLPPKATTALGFHAMVGCDGLLHLSGIAPFHGPEFAVVGKNDLKAQCTYVLQVLERALKAGSSSLRDVLDITVYLTDFDNAGEIGGKYAQIAPLLNDAFGDDLPCCTAVGAKCLFTVDQWIEIRAVAKTYA